MVRCLWAILPAAILWGASFPLALAAVTSRRARTRRGWWAACTRPTRSAPSLGALAVSLALVPWIGTQQIRARCWSLPRRAPWWCWCRAVAERALALAAALAAVAGWPALVLACERRIPIPGKLIAYGRTHGRFTTASPRCSTPAEGINSSVAITQWSDGACEVDVNGHVEATTEPYDMKLQRMVGHLPALLHPNPRIGAGNRLRRGRFGRNLHALSRHRTHHGCEIEPVIPPTSTRYFAKQDYDVLHNPRTRIVFDDARHYLLTTNEKFDIIATDPLDVFVKGTAALYTKEYFEAVRAPPEPRRHVHALRAPVRERRAHRAQRAGHVLRRLPQRHGVGQHRQRARLRHGFPGAGWTRSKSTWTRCRARLERPDYAPVVAIAARDRRQFHPGSVLQYAGQKSDLAPWIAGADLNRDIDLRLQYLARMGHQLHAWRTSSTGE